MITQPIYGVPASVEHWAIALAAVAAACSLLFCVQRAVRDRSAVPLYLFAAGGLVVLMEPFCDVLGRATFPELGTLGWISTLGRHIPLYVGLIYMMYWAPAWILLGEWFEAGMRPRTSGSSPSPSQPRWLAVTSTSGNDHTNRSTASSTSPAWWAEPQGSPGRPSAAPTSTPPAGMSRAAATTALKSSATS